MLALGCSPYSGVNQGEIDLSWWKMEFNPVHSHDFTAHPDFLTNANIVLLLIYQSLSKHLFCYVGF